MSWVVCRRDPDGSVHVIGCTDDFGETGCIMDEDRKGLDWEPEYSADWEVDGA